MTKHTPWHLDEKSLSIHFGARNGGISLHPDTPNALYNARLIAAAPEMYEALEDILFYCEIDDRYIRERAQDAIAKAEGK